MIPVVRLWPALLVLVLVGVPAAAATAPAADKAEAAKAPAADKAEITPRNDKELMDLIATAAGLKGTREEQALARDRAKTADQQRILATVAFGLVEGDDQTVRACLGYDRSFLKDKRLSPLLAKCISRSSGEVLLIAVRTAEEIPDKALLPALFDTALASDYVRINHTGTPETGPIMSFSSVFDYTARALHVITGGQVGLAKINTNAPTPFKEQPELRAQWRKWWAENKTSGRPMFRPQAARLPVTEACSKPSRTRKS